ncbi:MAG: type VI secretion system protein, partial [Geminicoccaceae bacterium]
MIRLPAVGLGTLRKLAKPGSLLPVILVIAAVAGIVLLRPYLPLWGWLLSIAWLVVCVLVWALVVLVPRYRQRRFLEAQGGVDPGSAGEPVRALEARLLAAREVLLHSPNLRARQDPLYWLPWYLVLGADDGAVNGLLRPPLADSPFPEPDAARDLAWSWWFYKGLVAIQVPAAFVCEPQQTEVRAVWYQALRLLDRHRPKLPLNGIVLLLRAETLSGPREALRETCARLRRLIDETLRLLQIEAPVYLVVGGCEALPGFDAFAGALPPEAARQAFGHRFADRQRGGLQSWLERGFDELRTRLHAIRLGLLGELREARARRDLFGFVEPLVGLKDGLVQAAAVLFEDNPYQRRPWLGGIYFTGAGAFGHDLFERFLPADQPLARKRRRARVLSWGAAMVAALLLLAGSAYVAFNIFIGSREAASLVTAAEAACEHPAVPGPALERLETCRQRIETLSAARPLWRIDLGFGRLAAAERDLKARFVAAFRESVTKPLDAALDDAAIGRALRFDDHLALARAWAVRRQCSEDAAHCGNLDPTPIFTS